MGVFRAYTVLFEFEFDNIGEDLLSSGRCYRMLCELVSPKLLE